MSSYLTVFRLRPDPLGQLAGNEQAPYVAPTWGAAVVIDPMAGAVQNLNGVATVSAAATVTTSLPTGFQGVLIVIVNDTGGVTVTFGTGFKPTATVNPTNGKSIVVAFIADSVAKVFREFSRYASAQ